MKKKLNEKNLKGIWAGVTLPWDENYQLDEGIFRKNLIRLCEAKVHGIYTTGSTGEFYTLHYKEFCRMVDIVMEVVPPYKIPVQIGCNTPNTRDTITLLKYVEDKGCDGAQVALPFWMELTDKEILKFFKDISRAVPSLPLIHYNIPRAKRFLFGADYCKIKEIAPNLIGVKFTFAGNYFGKLQEALSENPGLSYFVAENLLVSAMQLGARGSYSSLVCTNPNFMLRMFCLAEERKWDEAIKMQKRANNLFKDIVTILEKLGEGTIDPVEDKGLAVASGFFLGHQRTRPPYIGWSDETVLKIRKWIRSYYPEFLYNNFKAVQ